MNEWAQAELDALRVCWPNLEFIEAGAWVLIPDFKLPAGWSKDQMDLVVRIPENLPGQEPYGFWVRGGISLESGATPTNYAVSTEPPFENTDGWGQFSWSFEGWQPNDAPGKGTGMVHFVQSVTRRFSELN